VGSTEQPAIDACAAERFWSRVDKNGPLPEVDPSLGNCWVYGNGKRNSTAQRFAYRLQNGELTGERREWVCHRCGNGHLGCVRGSHIYRGGPSANSADSIAHGRLLSGERSKRAVYDNIQVETMRVLGNVGHAPVEWLQELFGGSINSVYQALRGSSYKSAGGPVRDPYYGGSWPKHRLRRYWQSLRTSGAAA
jgi:hypothetical protein